MAAGGLLASRFLVWCEERGQQATAEALDGLGADGPLLPLPQRALAASQDDESSGITLRRPQALRTDAAKR